MVWRQVPRSSSGHCRAGDHYSDRPFDSCIPLRARHALLWPFPGIRWLPRERPGHFSISGQQYSLSIKEVCRQCSADRIWFDWWYHRFHRIPSGRFSKISSRIMDHRCSTIPDSSFAHGALNSLRHSKQEVRSTAFRSTYRRSRRLQVHDLVFVSRASKPSGRPHISCWIGGTSWVVAASNYVGLDVIECSSSTTPQ